MELTQLEEIYAAYDRELAEANRKSSIFSGLFGQNTMNDPRYAPCNKTFYESTGSWVTAFARSAPSQEELLRACRFLTEAAAKRLNTSTYWYTLVAQGYLKELIPLMTPANRAILAREYSHLYPKRRRLPIQEEVFQLLTK